MDGKNYDSKFDVNKTKIAVLLADAGKLDVIIQMQGQILAKLDGRDVKEILANVDERLEKSREIFIEAYSIK
jgi:hypothetical protein